MTKKIDITSTAIEKGFDIAKDFLDKLILPSIEEVGLLMRDKITYWKFKNQVKILNKAKSYCDRNNISTKAISLKILCPLLENAALEENEEMQDKWAILLSNLVDSHQNIENHVFPYILSQLSINEFKEIEKEFNKNRIRVEKETSELEEFLVNKPILEKELNEKKEKLEIELKLEKNKSGVIDIFQAFY
jgi:hypothetical protein